MTCSSGRKLKSLPYYDSYSFEFGIRSISWSGTENNKQAWKINSEPFYCAGVNRHEDAAVIGRGIDFVMIGFKQNHSKTSFFIRVCLFLYYFQGHANKRHEFI